MRLGFQSVLFQFELSVENGPWDLRNSPKDLKCMINSNYLNKVIVIENLLLRGFQYFHTDVSLHQISPKYFCPGSLLLRRLNVSLSFKLEFAFLRLASSIPA